MSKILNLGFVLILFALGLVACSYKMIFPSEQQIGDLAWQALDPYTSSHKRDAWEIIEIKKVVGRDIIEQFKYEDYYGCKTPATLVPDSGVDPSKVYWFVHMEPRPATPIPIPSKWS